jgi:homoserine O-acetyltransferase/O-succinyltransferase
MSNQEFTINGDAIALDSGVRLPSITIAYQTYGKLSSSKDNVILICHPLTGDAKAMDWWPNIVGPGLAIDTDKYFVVCSNVLGGCAGSTGPSSVNPDTNQAYLLDFPVITIGDMVRCQRQLVAHLGVASIKMVIGGSMGGMQALEWVAQVPEMIQACVPIASSMNVSPLAVAFDSVGRKSILEHLNVGDGKAGLAVARQLGHITYLSEDSMSKKFSRRLQDSDAYKYTLEPEFEVESYLNYQGNKFLDRFDVYSYLTLTKAVSYFDLERSYGSVQQAFEKAQCKFLVMAITSDWLYTPEQSKALTYELMKLNHHVSYVEIDSDYGHDTFLINSDETKQAIGCFLESI